ncbi:MAG: M1 family metallopeptidase [Anaerolineae bacterium]
MKKTLYLLPIVFLLLASACQATPTPTPLPASTPVPYRAAMISEAQADVDGLTNPTRYFIDLVVDVENLTLTGSEQLLYTNNETVDLKEVYFRLFPNTPGYGGAMEIERVVLNGQEAQVIYELSNSALKVPLAKPLAPGEQLDITLDFLVRVPQDNDQGYNQFVYSDGVLAIPNFYPIVPVYDDEGWNIELAPGYGDAVYSDTSLYLVQLTVPQEMVVATSGSVVARADNGDGTVTLTCASGPMRDFSVVMSDEYQVVSDTVGQTTINSYYMPDDEEGGREVLEYASQALQTYNELFGLYPFSEFDVMETPTTAGGIEYPGLIVMNRKYYDEKGGNFEFTTAHEVAHQWWYSLVGNDQVDDPWLDEALTQYSTLIYFEEVHGKGVADSIRESYFEEGYQKTVEEGRDAVVAQPVAAFSPEDYGPIVYVKGPLFFHALRQQVGDDVYFEIMRRYLEQHKYGIATPESFLALAEEVSGQSLDEIYHRWILSAKRD